MGSETKYLFIGAMSGLRRVLLLTMDSIVMTVVGVRLGYITTLTSIISWLLCMEDHIPILPPRLVDICHLELSGSASQTRLRGADGPNAYIITWKP
jgi:hypothetical protein